MTYLVTGGGGFIGSNLVRHLLHEGKPVRVFDNFSTGRRDNLIDVAREVDIVEADLTNYYAVQRAMKGVDYVLHQGALPSVPRSVEDPVATTQVNVLGTLNVLTAARDAGVRRVVVASSSSVYGDTPTLPKREDMLPQPRSPYSASKLAAEVYARVFWETYGLETVTLRYFNVFGPYQDPNSQYSAVIPKFITSIIRGEALTIFGDGEQSRDFTFVANVMQANLAALSAPREAFGKAFNIACGQRFSLNYLVSQIQAVVGKEVPVHYKTPRLADVKHSQADIGLARSLVGYDPAVSFTEGLRQTVEWYLH